MESMTSLICDYFFISGVYSLSYGDAVFGPPRDHLSNGGPPSPQVDATIEEGSEGEAQSAETVGSPRATARHSRTNSWNRLSKISSENRNSIQTVEEAGQTASNRSSMTIKGLPTNGTATNGTGGELSSFDFDKALFKFANERENFLDDLSFTAGAPVQKPAPMTNPRASRLRIEENGEGLGAGLNKRSPLRSVGGSIRRRISFRDMSSVKKQPSMVQRNSKFQICFILTVSHTCLENAASRG
jgi:hypothetical protein